MSLQHAYSSAAAKFKPQRTRVLFVAEAPPSDIERYFYFEQVKRGDWLWIALMKALYPSDWHEAKTERERKPAWLRKFQKNEFFLLDACKESVSGTNSQRRKLIAREVGNLIEEGKRLAPAQIVLIKTTVHDALCKPFEEAGLSVANKEPLPFPSSGQQAVFHARLRSLIDSGVLIP